MRFPYVCVDVETTGLNPETDEVIEVCAIEFDENGVSGQVFNQLCSPMSGIIPKEVSTINGITLDMVQGKPNYLKDGIQRDLVEFCKGKTFVGHNIVGFDREFINMDIAQNGFHFEIEPHEIIDTGLIYKAGRMCVEPRTDELLSHFFKRIAATRSNIKWNLALAMQELHLDTRFSLNLDDAHDAGFDCYMTHLLFEELRQLADGAPSGY